MGGSLSRIQAALPTGIRKAPRENLMPVHLVTVAAFDTAAEVDLARNHLEAEGIPTYLADEAAVGWLWAMSNAVGGIKVQVAEENRERALAILEGRQGMAETQGLAEANPPTDAETDLGTEAGSESWEPDLAGQPEEDSPEPSPGDNLAKYALRAAILGLLLCPPILHLYSVWLLFRLALFQGDVSADSMRKGIVALVIDTMVIITVVLLIRSL
jgi:hypothetical protein